MTKRKSKVYPPGTFIPFPQRIMSILQLCIVFSVILWIIAQPFMGDYFAIKKRILLYESAMGIPSVSNETRSYQTLKNQKNWFEELPIYEKMGLAKAYQALDQYLGRSVMVKIMDGLHFLFKDISILLMGWLAFSVVIPILVLKKVEGAKQTVWILPILAIAYSANNIYYGTDPTIPMDHQLFPTENALIEKGLMSEISTLSVLDQKKQLEEAWKTYLIKTWNPDSKLPLYEYAQFQFTIERLKLLQREPYFTWLRTNHQKDHPFWLFLYIIWNFIFAWIIFPLTNRYTTSNGKQYI